MRNTDKDRTLAAALTFLVALAILLFLFFGGISWDPATSPRLPTPELMPEEELFIEPELVELGEEVAVTKDKAGPDSQRRAGASPGRPCGDRGAGSEAEAQSEAGGESRDLEKESTMKADEPSQTDKERQKATSSVANKFAPTMALRKGPTRVRREPEAPASASAAMHMAVRSSVARSLTWPCATRPS